MSDPERADGDNVVRLRPEPETVATPHGMVTRGEDGRLTLTRTGQGFITSVRLCSEEITAIRALTDGA